MTAIAELVGRLREGVRWGKAAQNTADMALAATTIETLAAALAEARGLVEQGIPIIEGMHNALDAAEAERDRYMAALQQAVSDIHLVTLHGELRAMWLAAREARDRAQEACDAGNRMACVVTNCRNTCPAGEALCSKHRSQALSRDGGGE